MAFVSRKQHPPLLKVCENLCVQDEVYGVNAMKLAIMILVLGPTLATHFQGGRAASQQVHRDLAYAEPKNPRQMLDVYAPAEGSNRPVIFWIHGGGWQRG